MIHYYPNLEEEVEQHQYAQNEPKNEVIQVEKEEDNEAIRSDISQNGKIDSNSDFNEKLISFFKNLILSSPLREFSNQNPESNQKKPLQIDEVIETEEESSSVEEVKPKKVVQTKASQASKTSKLEPQTKRRTAGKRKEPTKGKQKGKIQDENGKEEGEESEEEQHTRKKTKKTDAKNKKKQ